MKNPLYEALLFFFGSTLIFRKQFANRRGRAQRPEMSLRPQASFLPPSQHSILKNKIPLVAHKLLSPSMAVNLAILISAEHLLVTQ